MLKQFIKQTPFGISIFVMALTFGLFVLIAPIGGNKALIVRSGSMQPTIGVGDLVTVRPKPEYKAGDIIAFKDLAKSSIIVSHRIVSVKNQDGRVFYQTKGDANKDADFNLVPAQNVVGSAWAGIKRAGRIFAFTKTKTGFFAVVAIPAAFVIVFEILNIIREVKKQKRFSPGHPEFISGSQMLNQVQHDIKKLKHLYHHYGKPMGLPHPSTSFRSLFSMLSLRGSKGRSNLENRSLLRLSPDRDDIIGIGFKSVLPVLAMVLLTGNTLSFFSDTETSTGNLFQAAESFGPPEGIADHIVISEVQITGGPSHTTNDFIELYNPTGSSINLGTSGYRLVKRSGSSTTDTSIKVFTSSNIIPAHGFFLWANSGFTTISTTPDVTTTDTLAASNSIALKDASGAIIDALSWNSAVESYKEGTAFSPDPGANESMERKALSTSTAASMTIGGTDEFKGNGYDTNNNSTDFILRTTSQPQNSSSPTETP